MKKIFRKLACCSFLSIASIVCFDAEARVTKEVAEAVIPYLMEAAGIPEDSTGDSIVQAHEKKYKKEKIQAILDMIYTDDGQQQMVKWAVNNARPVKLSIFGEPFSNDEQWKGKSSNKGQFNEEKLFQILFPCKTGTFTSFANHSSRFGYTVLTNYESVKNQLLQWIIDGNKPSDGKNNIVAVGNNALDCKIARIIFILDIFDDPQQICDVCVNGLKEKGISEALAKVNDTTSLSGVAFKKDAISSAVRLAMDQILNDESEMDIANEFQNEINKKNKSTTQSGEANWEDFERKVTSIEQIQQIIADIKEYSKQLKNSIPASTANQEYTCRPVSAIIANREGDCVETLYRHLINIAIQDDKQLDTLHYSRLPVPLQKYYNKDLSGYDVEIKNMSESGASCVRTHERWKQALEEIAEHGYFFGISSASIINLARTLYCIAFWHEDRTILNLRADTPLEVTAAFIQAAMNKLANADGRFAVKLVNNVEDSTLPWVSAVVEIDDTKLKRLIKVGICDKRNANFGHAEIISISK